MTLNEVNKIIVEDDGGHAAIANSKALDLAGITNETKNPTGGEIQRDKYGVATGVLYGAPAMKIVLKHHPRFEFSQGRGQALKLTKILLLYYFMLSFRCTPIMARPLRIEFSGVRYPLTARGNAQQAIFIEDNDRSDF